MRHKPTRYVYLHWYLLNFIVVKLFYKTIERTLFHYRKNKKYINIVQLCAT